MARDRDKCNLSRVLWGGGGGVIERIHKDIERPASYSNPGTKQVEERGLLGPGTEPRQCVRWVRM